MASAAEAGMGICLLPDYVAAPALQRGTLLRLLPQYRLQEKQIHALYPSRRFLDAKIRTAGLSRSGTAARLRRLSPGAAGRDALGLNDCCALGKGVSPAARFSGPRFLELAGGSGRATLSSALLAESLRRPAVRPPSGCSLVAASFIPDARCSAGAACKTCQCPSKRLGRAGVSGGYP